MATIYDSRNTVNEAEEMTTYIIEVGTPTMSFWELEKVRARSLEEAKAELVESYGADTFFGYSKAVY